MQPLSTCCDDQSCIGQGIATQLDSEPSIIDRIHVAAWAVATSCESLSPEKVQLCASRLFDVTAESNLSKAFLIAYQTQREELAASRQLEKQYTASYRCPGYRLM